MNNDPLNYPQQDVPTPPEPVKAEDGIYSANPHQHGRPHMPAGNDVREWIKRTVFGLAIIALLGGTGYGLNNMFGQIREEQAKLASAKEANDLEPADKKVYFGDGSDILQVAPIKQITACARDFTESPTGGCIKTETKTADPVVHSLCPADYPPKGNECVRLVGGTVETKPATLTQSCIGEGFSLSGSMCTKIEKVDPIVTYICTQSGFDPSGSGAGTKCTKTGTQSGNVIASCTPGYWGKGTGATTICYYTKTPSGGTTVFSCPDGSPPSGSSCSKQVSVEKVTTTTYTCPVNVLNSKTSLGYSIRETTCYFSNKLMPKEAKCYYQGSSGSNYIVTGSTNLDKTGAVSNTKCWVGGTKTVSAPKCPSAYPSCIKTTTYSATSSVSAKNCDAYPGLILNSAKTECYKTGTVTLSCDPGFAKSGSGSGTTCLKIDINNVSATAKSSCPSGGLVKDNKCEKTTTVSPQSSPSCEYGYTPAGTQCSRTVGGTEVKANPAVTRTCPDLFIPIGTGSAIKCEKKETSTAEKQTKLVCDDGWIKRQSGDKFDCVLTKA